MSHPRLVRFDFCCMISELRLQFPGEPCMGCTLSFYNLSEFCVCRYSSVVGCCTYDPSGSLNRIENKAILLSTTLKWDVNNGNIFCFLKY